MADVQLDNNFIKVSGNLDFSSVVDLWEKSLPLLHRCKELNFDFTKVTTTNSSGLALLMEWIKYSKQHGKPIRFTNVPSQFISFSEAAGMEKIFD